MLCREAGLLTGSQTMQQQRSSAAHKHRQRLAPAVSHSAYLGHPGQQCDLAAALYRVGLGVDHRRMCVASVLFDWFAPCICQWCAELHVVLHCSL
jgi:hypothetical protein